MSDKLLDCLIIGGGPAGLTAAIYLARFHLNVKVVDAGNSRATWIPVSHNHAGFPEGIHGADLIGKMAEQARMYGAHIEKNRVTRLDVDEEQGGFIAEWGSGPVHARTVLLATGVMNRRPSMDKALHDEAMARGLIRYCPICDGYEVTDKQVGVIGTDEHGIKEAVFLRGYTADLTLIAPHGPHRLTGEQRAKAHALGIRTVDGPCRELEIEGDKLAVPTAEGRMLFDSVYPALGSDVHSDLAKMVGADVAPGGCIVVDDHQRCSIPGLYAAG
ncbi:MAG: Thioredoxin reductase, partial [uncultured Sphingomonadaceae bacterium]